MSHSHDSLSSCWPFVSVLDRAEKQALIDRLTQDLAATAGTADAPPSPLSAFYGAWDSRRSAEEILEEIRDSRCFSRTVEGL